MSVPGNKEVDDPTIHDIEAKPFCEPEKVGDTKGMRRHTLKRGEKLRILEERDRRLQGGQTFRLCDLQEWAQKEFKLENPPSRSAMSRILCTADKSELIEMPTARRKRGGRLPDLEVTLAKWVRSQRDANITLKGDLIKEKGKSLLEAFNATLPPSERISMQFSAGWLCNFQRRWDLRLSTREQKGDAGDGSSDADLLEQVIGRDVGVADDPCNLVRAPVPNGDVAAAVVMPLAAGADQGPVHYVTRGAAASPPGKRKRIPFWFIGLGKLTHEQFATRFVSYICQHVQVSDKAALRLAACSAASGNGIDGFTVAFGSNSNDQIACVLLDDLKVEENEKEAIVTAGKQYFHDLEQILGNDKQFEPPEKRHKLSPQ